MTSSGVFSFSGTNREALRSKSSKNQKSNQSMKPTAPTHVYEIRPRKDDRGVDLISDALLFGRLWYERPDHAIGYAQYYSRSHYAVIRAYDDASNVIQAHEMFATTG
jgi:hypothetical protein